MKAVAQFVLIVLLWIEHIAQWYTSLAQIFVCNRFTLIRMRSKFQCALSRDAILLLTYQFPYRYTCARIFRYTVAKIRTDLVLSFENCISTKYYSWIKNCFYINVLHYFQPSRAFYCNKYTWQLHYLVLDLYAK